MRSSSAKHCQAASRDCVEFVTAPAIQTCSFAGLRLGGGGQLSRFGTLPNVCAVGRENVGILNIFPSHRTSIPNASPMSRAVQNLADGSRACAFIANQ